MKRRSLLVGLAMTACTAALPGTAGADWPERTITMVVPFAAGGGTDTTARIVAEKLTKELGQDIVIENRAGAGANIGAAHVASATPDGYTLLVATSTLATNVTLYKSLRYDLRTDLIPVSQLLYIPNVLVVSNDVPARTLAEFIEYARSKKGALNYGTAGNGSSQHLSAALFNKLAEVDMVHVPYKGGAPAANDLVAGHLQVIFAPLVEVLSFIEAGKLRALAVTTKERSRRLPDLPTLGEVLPGYEIALWVGMFAPKGTPQAIVDRLGAAVRKAMAHPAVHKTVEEQGSTIVASTPEEFKPFLAAEIEKWGQLVKLSGAKIN
jgi:tripartite-type tricarboxylate transporter receptor subunit TctC